MTTIPEPATTVTRYEVSCLPETSINRYAFTITVEYRGNGRWAVRHTGAYLDAHGGRSFGVRWEDGREPVTAEEIAAFHRAEQEWEDAHRFTEEEALRIAREQAPKLVVMGWTVAAALAAYEAANGH